VIRIATFGYSRLWGRSRMRHPCILGPSRAILGAISADMLVQNARAGHCRRAPKRMLRFHQSLNASSPAMKGHWISAGQAAEESAALTKHAIAPSLVPEESAVHLLESPTAALPIAKQLTSSANLLTLECGEHNDGHFTGHARLRVARFSAIRGR
jgi:hypothetical protein